VESISHQGKRFGIEAHRDFGRKEAEGYSYHSPKARLSTDLEMAMLVLMHMMVIMAGLVVVVAMSHVVERRMTA
jgi:hypothetical protein